MNLLVQILELIRSNSSWLSLVLVTAGTIGSLGQLLLRYLETHKSRNGKSNEVGNGDNH